MGLLTILKKQRQKEKEMRILMLSAFFPPIFFIRKMIIKKLTFGITIYQWT